MGSSSLKEALKYGKFKTEFPRVLIFKAAYFMLGDLIEECKGLGWHILTVDTPTSGKASDLFVSRLLKKILVFKPDFLLTVNHFGFDRQGLLARLLDDYEIPVASWFIDNSRLIMEDAVDNAVDHAVIFSFERDSISWLKQNGFKDPQFLPTGSSRLTFHPRKIDPAKARKLGRSLGFVGNSWWEKASSSSGEVSQIASRSMARRVEFITELLPLQLSVHGDPNWNALVPGIQVLPPLDPRLELPHFYAGTDINLNISAVQAPTAANQRVWDVPGVQGFLITDAQEDVLESFEDGIDVVVYNSLEEAKDKIRYYRAHPSLRDSISIKGFQKVEQSHRLHHRLLSLHAEMALRFED